jgi:AraC-like DNA-binding protein
MQPSRLMPTVTGFAAQQAIACLQRRNVATPALLPAAGLSERDFAGETSPVLRRMPAAAQAKLLAYAAEAVGDSAFGLHLAEQSDPREAGILFYVTSGAENLRDALALFARYFRIVNEALRVRLVPKREGVDVEMEFVGLSRHSLRQNAEFGVAVILKALREMTGQRIRPVRVAFAHVRGSPMQDFERFFGCIVEFGAASDLIEFSNDDLATPLVTADAKLRQALRPFCDMAARERGAALGTLRAAVENEIEKLLPHGKAQARTVAKALALSTRTLSRRLAEEGVTYAEVVDQLRRSLALQYLKEPGVSLSQIAWLLGYRGSTSFNRAFKRLTGRLPSEARNERVSFGPDSPNVVA